MRDILNKYGIPSNTLAAAVGFLNEQAEDEDSEVVTNFNAEFGLTPNWEDAGMVARFIVDAILRGAEDIAAVKGYVTKRLTGNTPPSIVGRPVVVAAAPVYEDSEVVVTAVEDVAPAVAVKGKRGRKKNGLSAMCKAVAIIEGYAKGTERQTVLDALVSAGINKSSAAVYMWRYNNGERD